MRINQEKPMDPEEAAPFKNTVLISNGRIMGMVSGDSFDDSGGDSDCDSLDGGGKTSPII
jgi:hypothetical protein